MEDMEELNVYAAQLSLNFSNPVKVLMLNGNYYPVRRIDVRTVNPAIPEGHLYVSYRLEDGWYDDIIAPRENFVFVKG